jgi:arylsulfatase
MKLNRKHLSRRQFLIGLGALGGTVLAGSAGAWLFDGWRSTGRLSESGKDEPRGSDLPRKKPNVILILADDLGYSDIGCYGGHIETPHLDRLAANGIRLTQFYNTARCSPARASLLTGLHPHQAGMAHLQGYFGPYTEKLSDNCVTIAEVLRETGYGTYMAGKWHLGAKGLPHQRGFDKAYVYPGGDYFAKKGIKLNGTDIAPSSFGNDYYSTDDMTTRAIGLLENHMSQTPDKPFFLYMAYTAPHFPLHAKEADIAKYKGRFDRGWDALREEKFERMKKLGVIDSRWELPPLEASAAYSWAKEPNKAWRLRAMEVYAAMVDCMDRNIGRLVSAVENAGQLDDTMIIFLSDNGGNSEFFRLKDSAIMPGGPGYKVENGHYGTGWASLSNTPFRMYKHYIHQGGIASPFIVHWPAGLKEKGAIRKSPAQLPDVMATIVEVTGAKYPEEYKGKPITPLEGASIMPILRKDTATKEYLFWEHEGNCGVRHKNWKLVRFRGYPWELYDVVKDGTEMHDLSGKEPDIVKRLSEEYDKWTKRTNVQPYEEYSKYKPDVGGPQDPEIAKVRNITKR